MGKAIGGLPEAPAVGPAAELVGRYLSRQRRLRGISLADLSAQTRIPMRSLERLESGAFDHTPDGFSRGFVRTVAVAIGLDADEAVARMLREPTPRARPLWPRAGRLALAMSALAGVALLGLAVHELTTRAPAPPGSAPQLPMRTDYVRKLASERGLWHASADAADSALPPVPAEPPSEAPTESAPAAPPPAPLASPL